ncbi:uncharacterized protein LOC135488200 isoform X2 [Lineus longissimus]|uniref:uncharacterized protein LOC135488200 isoform X2 n=1 Tax=Lineus longissimus TaxID=88925 RepID=UPI00315CA1E2
MMEDLSPAITAIKAMQFAAEDIFASFHMSREDVLAIIPQHDDESNTIEKFTKHYIPKEFHFRHHLEDVLPEEFSCDEETLCAETFYHALLDFLSILKAHVCIILQLEEE